ncbi:protoporphyrinogen/coproporphyrinogen oxidase [Citrobacter amalonaticus]|uniref:protoporphyrinogen/coproporphyrinogen oxidase n=1 Tax=Citrobacter amalonaticus TaxID=35703 RepID=UPI001242D00D|nr:FAD-dependent oxidoreductase [Citrobacter amalonaticus]MBE0395241.1 FAD-dependent oxidoreductase [Citrobacter amalonaticus]
MIIANCDYLVLGGGVSGLMFANKNKDNDVMIIEKENELGGYCRTVYQDGYIWDYAGHFFHFANPQIKNFFETKISSDQLIVKEKCTKIFYKDKILDFPFQANIHQLGKNDFIDCLYDLYFKEEKEIYSSFLDMLYGKFGRSITEMFLKPYNEKLYACDLNNLDQNAMGRFFPYANFEQIVRGFKENYHGSYNSHFLYPKKGAKVFIDALTDELSNDIIHLSEEVLSISLKEKYVITNRRKITFKYLINTIPFNKFLNMITDIDYSEVVKNLSWNKVLVLNLGFDKNTEFNDIHWAYFPEKSYNFYRVGFYNNILNDERLSLYVEIGYSDKDSFDIHEQLDKTLLGLRDSGIINDHKLISYIPITMNPAYVHIDSSLNDTKQSIKNELSEFGVFTIGRYGDWKYCSIEDSMIDAVNLAEKI